jgi:hypothetical protein
MNSHTVACGGVFGMAAAGVVLAALAASDAVGANGGSSGPVVAVVDEQPISSNKVARATVVTLRFKRLAGAGRRNSMVRSQRKSSTYSLKT